MNNITNSVASQTPTNTTPRSVHAHANGRPSLLRIYALQTRNEILNLARTPMFVAPTLLFPLAFYLMFGVVLNRGNAQAGLYLLATYGVFGMMGASMFGFGVTLATERSTGLLRLRRALPMPPAAWLVDKLCAALLFSLVISLSLLALATGVAGVTITPMQALGLVAVNLLGTLPFCALGLYIGSLSGANGAVAIINLLFLPMAFLSGLWMPLSMLPDWLASLAPIWPAWHLAQLALKVVGMDAGHPVWLHLGVLLVVATLLGLLARNRLARAD